MADETWNSGSVMGQYLSSLNWEKAQEHARAICAECGGHYRPAGGPCMHEHPAPKKQEPGPWARSAQLLPAMYAGIDDERWSPATQQGKGDQDRSVAICADCGGTYRPAGGPCIHEHPRGVLRQAGPVCCLVCGEAWRPGHACVAQPTMAQVQELAAMGSVLRLMDELMEHLADELGVAAPEPWEAV